ncbi:putative cell cycle inhibitor Nif1 [Diplogelasinospora grovesii]|uniref:Cell cycle inhibitor Nif1 n=1 Tax=Diplogelasinospora grovesii TaxID=303347 RepID=A0AAN6N5E0_9PEZI|nr:putative cell cycle inhibitor Nif1 [Diplogelasinospora grovesii]
MGIRDLLKKKQTLADGEEVEDNRAATVSRLAAPEFTFVRSDTYTEEVIHPPGGTKDNDNASSHLTVDSSRGKPSSRLSLDVFRSSRSRSTSVSSNKSSKSNAPTTPVAEKGGSGARRLSHRLHLSRSPVSSENVPQDLPEIVTPLEGDEEDQDGHTESQWEKRATMLARENEKHRSRPNTPVGSGIVAPHNGSTKAVSSKAIDEDIQEAIKLHEEGRLEESTALFGRLADPKGANNPLSQVLYGLALRHGWGCTPNPGAAVNYLSAAASNAAEIENMALHAGLKKGGAAKGELVLAIFELANCFRHGWGIPKDPIAAKQYYETAANLGDTDAMNEVAWCYLEGFGTKKDKFAAARYYRLAENNGNKIIGNTWIWKDKYDPGHGKK